jgi:superfamily II DNA or RNA helicase
MNKRTLLVHNGLNKIQTSAIKAINKDLKAKGKALLVLATGLGKTETAIKIIKQRRGKHLWVVGRNSLVEQTYERFIDNGVHGLGIVNGPNKEFDADIIIASVQTVSKSNILKKFARNHFSAVWIDEAHHAAANSYEKVIKYFKSNDLVGLTATPDRPDYRNIYDIFGKSTFEKKFETAQKLGVLAQVQQPLVILTNSVLEGLKTKDGDYSASSLDRLYHSVQRNEIIIDSYKKYGRAEIRKGGMKPKAICFCINVNHAKNMAKAFTKSGVKAEFICGSSHVQNKEDRERIEMTFRTSNDIEVLCAVDLFNEGVDIPDANIALMARPTRSPILFQQQLGRVARIDEGRKKFFVVLDYVDNCRKGFNSYTVSNLKLSSNKKIRYICKYLNTSDPVLIQKRIDNYRDSLNNFIKTARQEYDLSNDKEVDLIRFLKTGKKTKGMS